MASTYEPIASITLTSDAANIEFSSIGSSWTDLVVVANLRATTAAGTEIGYFRVGNGSIDTGTNYSATYVNGDGTSAFSGRTSSASGAILGSIYGDTAASGKFTTTTISFMSYANTNVFKTALMSLATPDVTVNRIVYLWRSTSAITNVRLYPAANHFKSGSSAHLYGIKAA